MVEMIPRNQSEVDIICTGLMTFGSAVLFLVGMFIMFTSDIPEQTVRFVVGWVMIIGAAVGLVMALYFYSNRND